MADLLRFDWLMKTKPALALTAARTLAAAGAFLIVLSALPETGQAQEAMEEVTEEAQEEAFAEDDFLDQFDDSPGTAPSDDVNDPFEGMNRFFFKTNQTLDRFLLKPVARAYDWTVPTVLQNVARSFINNLEAPVTLANDLLQGEVERAMTTTMRFAVNTTFGFLGAADVAQELGLERHTEDFGQTLGVYGVGEGPYLFLPALGPAPPRDLVGRFVDNIFNPLFWITFGGIGDDWIENAVDSVQLTTGLVGIVDARARNLEALDEIERTSIDFYATVRSLYRQSRDGAIRNGRIDIDDLPDIDELE